jgi:hypothetical protein
MWPKNDLLFTLGLSAAARRALCDWHWKDRELVSLEEVFELVISSDEDPRPGYVISRLLDVRNVGRIGLLKILRRISNLEFGTKCRLAWEAKYQRILNGHRLKGADAFSWSFPITEEGKSMARYKTGGLHRPREQHEGMSGSTSSEE